jgi:thiamine kinase
MSADACSISLPELLASIDVPILRGAKLVAELSGGPVSRSWQLATSMGDAVLRLDLPLAAELQLDRTAEISVLKSAAMAGIGPEFFWADTQCGLLLTQMMPGKVWADKDLAEPKNLLRLGELLSQLHSIPVVHESPDLRITLNNYARSLGSAKARAAGINAEKLLAELNGGGDSQVFCHRDVHGRNIVDNGELRLIDWEYAGSGDPCWDLAVVAQQHQLGPWQLNHLLDGYSAAPYAIDSRRFQQFCRLYDYIATLWYMLAEQVGPLEVK